MINKLTSSDIDQVANIHKQELSGFLPELGETFLKKFYKASLSIASMFTFVYKEDGQILGFVSGITTTKGLYIRIIFSDILGFGWLFLIYFITHPESLIKIVKILTYPGFSSDTPELLTIAVVNKYQGMGIGRRLFEETVKEFSKRGIRKFKISVYERLPANGFYLKLGCKKVSSFDFLGETMVYYSYES